MERITISDGTTWPDPSGHNFQALAWRLRYAHESLDESCFFAAAEIIEAYSSLILHPAFTLKTVQGKIGGIRKAITKKS
ncbi:MAG: hypothetical protein SWO11_21230 [Thermodesulfobacteriota bacterium]|nr:hypothetical protein [Thermodesulfobacteriota bacterium]